MSSSTSRLRIHVVVDNFPSPGFRDAWGVGYFVETSDSAFAFDAGPEPEVLKHNAERMGLDYSKASFAVLSHEHGDHAGGLPYIAEAANEGLKTYLPASADPSTVRWLRSLGLRPIGVKETIEVAQGVYVLRELKGPPWEVAVAVKVEKKGIVILTGCSHPGVERFAEEAIKALSDSLDLVIGGLHLKWSSSNKARITARRLLELGLKRLYPIHCTGDRARDIIKREFPELYRDGHVGLVLEL